MKESIWLRPTKKKHAITLIGNPLTEDTLFYAAGKEAIIIHNHMEISAELVSRLGVMGINHVILRDICNNETERTAVQNMAAKVVRQLDLLLNLP